MIATTEVQLMILLVDDAPTNIQVLNEVLRDDYRLFFATSGRVALRLIAESPPDLIILDVIMPDMDGYEVCRALKANALLQDIPIIFITSMRQQEDEVIGLELGAVDYITKPFNPAIVRLRVRNQIELKRQRDLLARLSNLDGLTGIPNRRALDANLDREWRRCQRSHKPLSLIMSDIDHFKNYNDTYGHLTGDDCLKTVSSTLQNILERPGDLLARYGGEEFIALLPETDAHGAQLVAGKMLQAITNLALPHAGIQPLEQVSISIGVATILPKRAASSTRLMEAADQALYQSKQAGRNRISTWMDTAATDA
ncbi:MAG: diguanylate cyclase [Trichlorobacter sp.]